MEGIVNCLLVKIVSIPGSGGHFNNWNYFYGRYSWVKIKDSNCLITDKRWRGLMLILKIFSVRLKRMTKPMLFHFFKESSVCFIFVPKMALQFCFSIFDVNTWKFAYHWLKCNQNILWSDICWIYNCFFFDHSKPTIVVLNTFNQTVYFAHFGSNCIKIYH